MIKKNQTFKKVIFGQAPSNWQQLDISSFSTGDIYEITNDQPYIGIEEKAKIKTQNAKLEIYPNPFTFATEIWFYATETPVSIKIYDSSGNLISTIAEKNSPGTYKVKWYGKNSFGNKLPSGVYFYRLESPYHIISKKLIFLGEP